MIDNKDYIRAMRLASKVDFITDNEEKICYAKAVYLAIQWGKTVK